MRIERVVCGEHWKTCHHEMPTLITLCSLILSPCALVARLGTHTCYEERLVVYGLVQELAGGQYGGIESQHSLTHSLIHSHPHSLTHSLTHPLTHSLTHPLTYSHTHRITMHTLISAAHTLSSTHTLSSYFCVCFAC